MNREGGKVIVHRGVGRGGMWQECAYLSREVEQRVIEEVVAASSQMYLHVTRGVLDDVVGHGWRSGSGYLRWRWYRELFGCVVMGSGMRIVRLRKSLRPYSKRK